MRKYYQAALAVTAVVSLISLLIYRHEYNKLRYVLEVFNYFGKPGPRRVDANCTNISTFTTFNAKFDEPIPSWQRLEDDLYIYSAYGINDKEIRAVGLGNINSVSNMQCLVFFENESKPILGSFRFIPIGNAVASSLGENLRYGGYHFVCKYTSDETPTGITFVTKSNKYLNYAPIFPIKIQPRSLSVHSRIGVCVTQSLMKPTKSIDMIGFLSFHALIGMDNFIIYDSGISNEFNSRLKEMANDPTSFWKFTYTVIPWNFPLMEIDQNVIREIIETDCLYRTYNNVAYAIALSWNEYVNLKYHHAAIDLLANFKQTKLVAERYKLKTMTFCTQQADNKRYANSTLTVLKKTKTDINILENRSIYVHKPYVTLQNSHLYVREIGKDLIAVNQYKYCDNYKESQEVEDLTILRFAQDIQNSSILRKYLGLYNVLDADIK